MVATPAGKATPCAHFGLFFLDEIQTCLRSVRRCPGGQAATILLQGLQEPRYQPSAPELFQPAIAWPAAQTATDGSSRRMLRALWLSCESCGVDLAPSQSIAEIVQPRLASAFEPEHGRDRGRIGQMHPAVRQLPRGRTSPRDGDGKSCFEKRQRPHTGPLKEALQTGGDLPTPKRGAATTRKAGQQRRSGRRSQCLNRVGAPRAACRCCRRRSKTGRRRRTPGPTRSSRAASPRSPAPRRCRRRRGAAR